MAARHLKLWSFETIDILWPKKGSHPIFQGLEQQCHQFHLPVFDSLADLPIEMGGYDLIVDGIFGFSFDSSSSLRAPFDEILASMAALSPSSTPIVSIDVPSGWDVERGPWSSLDDGRPFIEPSLLISLTLPKVCIYSLDILKPLPPFSF